MITNTQLLNGYSDVLRPEEVQEILQTGRNTVYNYLAEGKIRSIKVGGKYRIPNSRTLMHQWLSTFLMTCLKRIMHSQEL